MIKKYRKILIATFALVASVCLFAGCKLAVNKSFDEFIEENQIKSNVTYILNEGKSVTFGDKNTVFNMFYPENAKPYEITQSVPAGASIGNAQISSYEGHEFLGWYLAETNEDGIPYYTDGTLYGSELAEGEIKYVRVTDVKFDFSKRLNDGDKIYLVAKWNELARVDVKLIPQDFKTLTDKNGTKYEKGALINKYYLSASGLENVGKYVFTASGYTFLDFYSDEDGNDRFDGWPIKIPEDGTKVITIYAKYIEGDWDIVRTASDFEALFYGSGNARNYYFMLDGTNEIDCSEFKDISPLVNFSGKIEGNGCTVKNLNISKLNIRSSDDEVALFGDIASTAVIKNITFENLTFTYSIRKESNASAYFFCTDIKDGATVTGVNISGNMTITVNEGAYLYATTEDTWLFGNASAQAASGIKVENGTQCVVNNNDGTHQTFTP